MVSPGIAGTLRRLKGLRNLLVHEYGRSDDELVFNVVRERLGDFEDFKHEILTLIRQPGA